MNSNKLVLEDGSCARLSRYCFSSATPTTAVSAYSNTLGSCQLTSSTYLSVSQSVESPRTQNYPSRVRDLNRLDFNCFSPVLKGDYITYRRKYLEGPVIGRGSFGVVRSLFSMVDLLALQQHLPVKLQLPANRLGEGIKCLPNNQYEFCGLSLCAPTRAVKIIDLYKLCKNRKSSDFLHVLRELSIVSWIDHPDIVKVTEIHSDCFDLIFGVGNNVDAIISRLNEDSKVYVVMEYCSGGDLTSRKIEESSKEEMIAHMFLHIFRALSYVNCMGIAHRDVKPENFLWTDSSPNASIKLADFGLANNPLDPLRTRAGTAYYVAPEIVKLAPKVAYTTKCDSWSAGIMLHIFLLGSCPYHADTDAKTLYRVANDDIDWSDECYARLPPDAYDLLRKLLVKDPSRRISTTEALNHRWLARVALKMAKIPLTVEEATGIVDNLTAFHKFPVLKQLALSLMVRQIQGTKIEEWRECYVYLSTFCGNERFRIDLDSVQHWLKHSMDNKDDPGYNLKCIESDTCSCIRCIPRKRRTSLRQMSLFKSVQKLTSLPGLGDHIGLTEFAAAQMATQLCQLDDLIADTFAGIRSDISGRRSVQIEVSDLRRFVNPLSRSCDDDVLEQVLHEAEASALTSHVGNSQESDSFDVMDIYRKFAKKSGDCPGPFQLKNFLF
ncbi:bifunctional Protein kinase [Babesia duncani]|uniref:Bifunctional Protein kinase n=1 Tax=Babesia duncani TaxID=323732 RepID=A0AAD9PJ78_9APIC|nr:bifunctional Protein kinase [Babesia duncani]